MGKPFLADKLRFLRQFFVHPVLTGAVCPSSPQLAREMVAWFDWDRTAWVVEFGPGTGAFTYEILRRKQAATRFFAIEHNPEFVHRLRERFPGLSVYADSVANVARLCEQEQSTEDKPAAAAIDAIVCGLPWAAFNSTMQDELLAATVDSLRPGGRFATFAYLQGTWLPAGMRLARKLEQTFRTVEKSRVVWRNFPPAFIYRCTK